MTERVNAIVAAAQNVNTFDDDVVVAKAIDERPNMSAEEIAKLRDKNARAIDALSLAELQSMVANRETFAPCLARLRGQIGQGPDTDPTRVSLQQFLNESFAGKEDVVRMALACTIAQVPMVLLGPPGTAKSAVVRLMCDKLRLRPKQENIGSFGELVTKLTGQNKKDRSEEDLKKIGLGDRKLFEYLVTRFTTPEEIIGPVKIDAMLELSMFYRESEGMLPNASIAFLDEIFKANSAILNALLSIINERIYYNAGRAFNVSLMMLFGASNEAPDTQELGALFDRFPIRVISSAVKEDDVANLLSNASRLEYARALGTTFSPYVPPALRNIPNKPVLDWSKIPKQLACVNDFRLLGRLLFLMYGGNEIFNPLFDNPSHAFCFVRNFKEMFLDLRETFAISDRTPERLLRVAKALALIDGEPKLRKHHLKVFQYCTPSMEMASHLQGIVAERMQDIEE